MNLHLSQGALDVILGVLILVQPKLIAWIIGIWLVLTGLISLGVIKF